MFKKLMRKLWSEKGQALVETGLIIVLVSIIAIGALTAAGQCVNANFDNIAQLLDADGTDGGGTVEDPNKLVPLIDGTTFYNVNGTVLTPEEDKYSDIAYCISTSTMSWGGYNTAQWCGEGTKDYSGVLNTAKVLPVLKSESGTIWSYCDSIRTTTEDNTWYVPAIGEIKDEYIAGGLKQLPLYVWTSTEGGTNQTSPTTSAMVFSTNGTVYNCGWQNKAGTTNSVAVLFRQNKFPDRNPEPFEQLDAYSAPYKNGKCKLYINSPKKDATNKWYIIAANSEADLPVASRDVPITDSSYTSGILNYTNGYLIQSAVTELTPGDKTYCLLIETDSNKLPLATAIIQLTAGEMPSLSIPGKSYLCQTAGYDSNGNDVGKIADAEYLCVLGNYGWDSEFMALEIPDGFVRPDNSILKIDSANGTWNFDALDPGFKAFLNSAYPSGSIQIWSEDDSGTQAWCAQKSATIAPNAVLTEKTNYRSVILVRQH